MDWETRARVQQLGLSVVGDGNDREVRSTRLGELMTVDWRQNLVNAAVTWRVSLGTFVGEADITQITGGGNGTTIDLDQPEMAIGVDAGYYLAVTESRVGCRVDMDANAEQAAILLVGDSTAGVALTAVGTPGVIIPLNMIDGQAAFPGRAYGGITTDITNPGSTHLLDYETIIGSDNGTAGNLVAIRLKMDYEPAAPTWFQGPCAVYLYFGGTAPVTGAGTIVVSAIPANWKA